MIVSFLDTLAKLFCVTIENFNILILQIQYTNFNIVILI